MEVTAIISFSANVLLTAAILVLSKILSTIKRDAAEQTKALKADFKERINKQEKQIGDLQVFNSKVRLTERCQQIHAQLTNDICKKLDGLTADFKQTQKTLLKLQAIEEAKNNFHKGENGYMQRLDRIENRLTKIYDDGK